LAFIVTDNAITENYAGGKITLATKDSAGEMWPALVSLATADVADVHAVVGFAVALLLEAEGEDVSGLTGEMW